MPHISRFKLRRVSGFLEHGDACADWQGLID